MALKIIALDCEKSTVTKKICQPNGANAFCNRHIVRGRDFFFLRWREIMHPIIKKLTETKFARGGAQHAENSRVAKEALKERLARCRNLMFQRT